MKGILTDDEFYTILIIHIYEKTIHYINHFVLLSEYLG